MPLYITNNGEKEMFLKQLFCKHEYKVTSSLIDSYGKRQNLECVKCKHETVRDLSNKAKQK